MLSHRPATTTIVASSIPAVAARPRPATLSDRRRLLMAGAAASVALIAYLAVWAGVSPLRQRGSDFSVDYVAAQLLAQGHGAALYDQALERAGHAAMLPAGAAFDLPFIGPPTAALLTLPLTTLGPEAAYRIWSLLQLCMLAGALVLAGRASGWRTLMDARSRWALAGVALAAPATLVLLLMGQWDGLLALALASAYAAWRRDRPLLAGLLLGLAFAATKPQLALGLAAFMLGRQDWRAVAGAAGGSVVAAGAGLALVGPTVVAGFAGSLGAALSNTPPQSTVGLAGLVSSWLGSGPVTVALTVAGSLLALGGATLLGRGSRQPGLLAPALGGAAALSLLAAPHVLTHDLAILAPALVWLACWNVGRARGEVLSAVAVWAGFSVLVALDAGNAGVGAPGRLVPWALAAFGAIALRTVTDRRQVAERWSLRLG